MDFESYSKIQNIGKCYMSITQKINGSNGQICIFKNIHGDMDLKVGSRNKWIVPRNVDPRIGDNYGFAEFVYNNKQEFIDKLGEGRHYGEWCGLGVTPEAEGLTEKLFVLFNWERFKDKELPINTVTVPVLYVGSFGHEYINATMQHLKENGSRLCKGFMKPEGVVITIGNQQFKKVFTPEEVAWKNTVKIVKERTDDVHVDHLLQPERLTKLFSRDESYIRNYPENIVTIKTDYINDLLSENYIITPEEGKSLGRVIYPFIKEIVAYYTSL